PSQGVVRGAWGNYPAEARIFSGRGLKAEGRGLSSAVLVRYPSYHLAYRRVLNLFGRFRRREPFDLALLLFRPFLPLALHLERKDAHFALDRPPVFEALRVGE